MASSSSSEEDTTFGSDTPYAEPAWYRHPSPYYHEGHRQFRAALRSFVDDEVTPFVEEWEEEGIPRTVYKRAAEVGLLPAMVGWPEDVPDVAPRPSAYDGFFSLIAMDELCRCASGGIVWGLTGSLGIGLPPVVHYGNDEMKRDVVRPCLLGEKCISLAVSEPTAGSDIAGLKTLASEDGDYYIISGTKKWITGGTFADYFTTAVRTGGEGSGMGGISLILIPSGLPGVHVKAMKCMGGQGSGTALIEFDRVRVPKNNFICNVTGLLQNFVTERLGLAVQANRFARVCLQESIEYARRRKVFGKALLEQPVVRAKLAESARMIDAGQAYIESLAYRLTSAEQDEAGFMGAILAMGADAMLCKVNSTKTFDICARYAAHIHGGNAYVRGNRIENLYRHVLSLSIPGGSEDVLIDAAARLSLQNKL